MPLSRIGMKTLIQEAARRLRTVKLLVVLTGAGISKESGIATFRDAQDGLWARYDPMELATIEGYLRNPKLVWQWYEYRFGMVEQSRPNAGHLAIASPAAVSAAGDGHNAEHRRPSPGRGLDRRDRTARQHKAVQVFAREAHGLLSHRLCRSGRNATALPCVRYPVETGGGLVWRDAA